MSKWKCTVCGRKGVISMCASKSISLLSSVTVDLHGWTEGQSGKRQAEKRKRRSQKEEKETEEETT